MDDGCCPIQSLAKSFWSLQKHCWWHDLAHWNRFLPSSQRHCVKLPVALVNWLHAGPISKLCHESRSAAFSLAYKKKQSFDFSPASFGDFNGEVSVDLLTASVEKTQILVYVQYLYCWAASKSETWRHKLRACFGNHGGFTWDHTWVFLLSIVYNIRTVAKLQRELWASNCFYWDSVSSWATKIFGLSRSEEINMALDEAAALWCSSPFVQGEDFAKLCDLGTSAFQSQSYCSFYTDIFSFDFWGQWACHYYHYYFIKDWVHRFSPVTQLRNGGSGRSGWVPRWPKANFSACTFSTSC